MSTAEPLVRYDKDVRGVVTLTLDRPQAFNSLSEAMIEALRAALDRVGADEAARVVVVAATGKAFCAGHDLKEMRAAPALDYYERLFADCARMMQSIVALPQPVIAQVQGIATAAGCQLVATCDLAVAAASARFATNGIQNGLYCATPSVALSRVVQRKHALEMLLTGDFIDAMEAKGKGLVNRVVPADALDAEIERLAGSILAKSAIAVRMGKGMFYRQLEMGLTDAYAYAGEVMACNMMSDDAGEGIDAFMQKRKPVYRGG